MSDLSTLFSPLAVENMEKEKISLVNILDHTGRVLNAHVYNKHIAKEPAGDCCFVTRSVGVRLYEVYNSINTSFVLSINCYNVLFPSNRNILDYFH